MKLTSRASYSAASPTQLIHVVVPNDTSQDPAGSSYKIPLQYIIDLVPANTATTESYWTSGSTGSFSIKAKNTSGLDATAQYAVAEGFATKSQGIASHAEGSGTTAQGSASHAEGQNSVVTSGSLAAHAEGRQTTASNSYAHSEGYGTKAQGLASHAEGNNTTASGNYSHAEGNNAIATGDTSHAEGYYTRAWGSYSHSEGTNTTASGATSHAEGGYTRAIGDGSHAEGGYTTAIGNISHAEGSQTTASEVASHAEGGNTIASGYASHAEGFYTIASGYTSHSEGWLTTASNISSHAEGSGTTASGAYSHAEGSQTKATGPSGHAEGSGTTAQGSASHAEGIQTKSLNVATHTEGSATTANNITAHAEGYGTRAFGYASHAEGYFTTTNTTEEVFGGVGAHAEGAYTTASNIGAHSEGSGTTADGVASHAGGFNSRAIGDYSFVHGSGSTANADNTIVLGPNLQGLTAATVYTPSLNIKTVNEESTFNVLGINGVGTVTKNNINDTVIILAAIRSETNPPLNATKCCAFPIDADNLLGIPQGTAVSGYSHVTYTGTTTLMSTTSAVTTSFGVLSNDSGKFTFTDSGVYYVSANLYLKSQPTAGDTGVPWLTGTTTTATTGEIGFGLVDNTDTNIYCGSIIPLNPKTISIGHNINITTTANNGTVMRLKVLNKTNRPYDNRYGAAGLGSDLIRWSITKLK